MQKYTLLTCYYKHNGSPDFNRKIVELSVLTENGTESWSPYIILIYYIRGDPHPITVQSHGNSMGSKAYSGAKPSTVNKINDQAKKGKLPQEIYESIIFEEGGYMKADNSSAFPRSLQQIHDVRRDRKLDYDVVRKFLFIFNRSCIKTVSISFSSDPLNILKFSMATIY